MRVSKRLLGVLSTAILVPAIAGCSWRSDGEGVDVTVTPLPSLSIGINPDGTATPDSSSSTTSSPEPSDTIDDTSASPEPSTTPSPDDTISDEPIIPPNALDVFSGYNDFCRLKTDQGLDYYVKQSDHSYIWFYLRNVDAGIVDYQNLDNGRQIWAPTYFPHWLEVAEGAGSADNNHVRINTASDWRSPAAYFDRNAPKSITPHLTVEARLRERPNYSKVVNTYSSHWRSQLNHDC